MLVRWKRWGGGDCKSVKLFGGKREGGGCAFVSSLNGSHLNRGRMGGLNGWEEPFGLHQ